jgi:hypothetical protein
MRRVLRTVRSQLFARTVRSSSSLRGLHRSNEKVLDLRNGHRYVYRNRLKRRCFH